MARDVSSILYRLALGSSLSLGCLAAVAGEAPRAAQEAHIKAYEDDARGEATAADTDITPLPETAGDETLPAEGDLQTEIITERYPNRAVRIERQVAQDADGNYFNHGPWSHWDENGVLKGSGEYRYGRRHGKWVRWFNANEGKILASPQYKQFQAPFAAEATFDNGKLHGVWSIFDSQGRLASEWQFEQGELHGKSIWYFPSGHKQREADYQNGQIEGQLMEWAFEADAASKMKNARTRQGELEHKLVTKATYANGRRQAPHIDYYSPGVKKAEGMYLSAKETTKTTYDFWNGEILTSVIGKEGVNQRHGHWTFWFRDGGKQMEGEFEQDKPVGKHIWWYSNGQKQAEGEFDAGLETGKWTWWHSNGQKMTEGEFVDGVQTGRWIRWSSVGLVEESKDYDKLSAAGEPRGPRPQTQAPPTPAPSTSELTPPSDRSTMRQPRPLRIESARRNPPVQGPMNQMKRHY